MTYIYFGAKLHINVMDILTNPKKNIIYVDSLPKNEYGYEFYKGFYRPNFYNKLLEEFLKYDYVLIKRKKLKPLIKMEKYSCCNFCVPNYFYPEQLIFKNNKLNKEVKYYISSGIPRYLTQELIDDMSKCYNIIISGHHPSDIVLNYLKLPVVIFGYNQTVFESEEDDINTILNSFENNSDYYLTAYLIDYNTNKCLKQVKNIVELNKESKKYWNI